MWRRVSNLVNNLITYQTLSPDMRLRRTVNQALRQRPYLEANQWFKTFWEDQDISLTTAKFVYNHFAEYSGIQFGRVLPSDRLEEDLCWTEVCWFDWEFSLCEDVETQFGFDISDRFYDQVLLTVSDLVIFLDEQIQQQTCLR